MSKNNWRESSASPEQSGASPEREKSKSSDRAGWSKSTASKPAGSSTGMGWFGKAIALLVTAGILGALFAIYLRVIPPLPKTPLVYLESFPDSQGNRLLSSNAFAKASTDLVLSTSGDISFQEANLQKLNDISVSALGASTDNKIVLFYVYSDVFLGLEKPEADDTILGPDNTVEPFLFTVGNALEKDLNLKLKDFLIEICRHEIGKEPPGGSHRIVVLDCGRLDPTIFSTVPPAAIAESVRTTIDSLKDGKVPNVDRLWVMLATDDYQLGWTAPELNDSVFGYFFNRGLMGDADSGPLDGKITLLEQTKYVRESVARWVKNYRDAVQTPVLLCGGDPGKAEEIELIRCQTTQFEPIVELKDSKSLHDDLWAEAYQIPQPHARQMGCARLARLEQLRYCKSQEYETLLSNVKFLIGESKNKFQFDEQKTSVFEWLSQADKKNALSDEFLSLVDEYLAPRPKPASKPTEEGKSNGNDKTVPSDQQQTAAVDNIDAPVDLQEPGAYETPIDAKLIRQRPEKRLAMIWHTIVHKLNKNQVSDKQPFDKKQLGEFLRLVKRNPIGDQNYVDLVEMQFLQLLYDNLPWQKKGDDGFDASVFFDAVRCFDASQSLIHGYLTSHSDVETQRTSTLR